MLTVELVPASTWKQNLRSILKPSVWDNLRRNCYAEAGNKCEVCGGTGAKGRVECHERWEFDEAHSVQRLVGVICLCPTCHQVKHIGRTLSMHGTKEQAVRLFKKLVAVNGWTLGQVEQHIEDAFKLFNERSQREWTIDISWLADNEGMLL